MLKSNIQDEEGIFASYLRLLLEGMLLKDSFTIHHYNIQNGSTVRLAIRYQDKEGIQLGWQNLTGPRVYHGTCASNEGGHRLAVTVTS